MANDVPTGIAEDYYQISEPVLSSFHKYRLPLDLFRLKEEIAQLVPYYKKDNRLSNEQVEEMRELMKDGMLFVSRSDHPIYSEHIVKQLDLVLVDDNLKEGEVTDIILRALDMKMNAFLEQPVKPVYDELFRDLMVFTEYLWNDRHKIRGFMRRLHTGEYSLARHSINCTVIGLWMLLKEKEKELTRKELDQIAIGLMLHDAGMSKVPSFITSKTKPLTTDDRDKIVQHVIAGAGILQKLDLVESNAKAPCLEHHERLDGSGYPRKIKAGEISRVGAMSAVVDSFSAMIQKRVYADAKPMEEAAKELMQDEKRYDKYFSTMLYTALVTGAIGKGK